MMKTYEKYKDSKVAWLGQVPEHWGTLRAKAMFDKQNRPVKEEHDVVTCFRDGMVTLRKNRRTTGFTESIKEHGYQGICKGDLVIHVMDAFAGAIGVSDSEGKATPVYSVCTAKGGYNHFYYAHIVRQMAKSGFIQSLYRGIRERSSDFKFDVFAKQYLPIPLPAEQEQIVRYLDWKVAMADKFVSEKKLEIALLRELRQAEINQSVTRGLDPNAPTQPSGIDWIGEIPQHWKRVLFGQCFSEVKEKNKDNISTNASSFRYGEIAEKNEIGTNEELNNTYNKYTVLDQDDIVINGLNLNYDYITQRVAIANYDTIITSAYISIRCKKSAMPQYACYLLKSFDNKKILNGMGKGIRLTLSFAELKKQYLFIPTIEEQQQIVAHIQTVEERINKAIEDIEKQIALVAEYKTSLIRDVTTGKVDVRGIEIPDYEKEEPTAIEEDNEDNNE